MRVVLTSHGSTGDIVPLVALGQALNEAGHRCVFAASPLFKDLIEGAGVAFEPVPPEWSRADASEAMRMLARASTPLKQLKDIYAFGLPYLDEYIERIAELTQGADLLVGSYLYPFLEAVAERAGAKFAVATYAHNAVPTKDNAPLPGLELPWLPTTLGEAWRKGWWKLADFAVARTLNQVIGQKLKAHGIPPVKSFFRRPAPLALVTVSEKLFAPPTTRIDPRFHFTGYWRYQTAPNEATERELDDFCQGEEVPVLNFGSVSFDDAESLFSRFLANWPEGKKLIVQSGWVGFSQLEGAEREEIKIIGHANHDRLFARASVVIHHGGAGTTASALHSGRPQIIIPHIADQHFWAAEVKRLGVALIGKRASWPDDLPRLVDGVESHAPLRSRAEEVAATLHSEHGPRRAVALLEDLCR
ncbi:MAG: glycosyltransferase [Puniceicoccales bacterium]